MSFYSLGGGAFGIIAAAETETCFKKKRRTDRERRGACRPVGAPAFIIVVRGARRGQNDIKMRHFN